MALNDDPVFAILSLKPAVSIPNDLKFLIDEDKLFSEFPEFSNIELQKLYNDRQKSLNYSDILQRINFDFPFRPDLIPLISNLDEKSDPAFKYRCRFILFTFIAWLKDPIMEHIPVIVHSLSEILNTEVSDCVIGAIQRCFQISFFRFPLEDFEIVFPLFKMFFMKNTEYALKVQTLLTQYLKALQISSQEKSLKSANEIETYLQFILLFIQKFPGKLIESTIKDLLLLSTEKLTQFDETALKIFELLSKSAPTETVISLGMLFPAPLKKLIEQNPPYIVLKDLNSNPVDIKALLEQENYIKIPEFSSNIKGQFQYVSCETFKGGLDIQIALNMSEKKSMKYFFHEGFYTKIKLLANALKYHEKAATFLFDWFAETLKDCKTDYEYFFDYTMIFIAFFKTWKFRELMKPFWNIIFNTILFDDHFNAVLNETMPPLIDEIRSTIIAIFAKDGFSLLNQIYESILHRPVLTAEITHRVMSFFDKIKLENLGKPRLIRTISALAIYFQDIHFNNDFHKYTRFVEISRSSLFLFISMVLQNNKLCQIWMEYPVFCSSFLKFVYEPPIRQFVLYNVKLYLLDEESSINQMVIDNIRDICSFAFDRIPQEQYVIISCEMLQAINEFLAHRIDHINLFSDMAESVCSAVTTLNESPVCGDFLVQAIHFFAVISSLISLDNIYLSSLVDATKKIFIKEPSNSIFSKFVQLVAGTPLSSISPSFIIKQPIALMPFIEIYKESKQLGKILQFIYNLISYSYSNSIIANEHNFDSNLLDLINFHKNDDDYDVSIINMLFSIVTQICCAIGSAPVIQKFINLMSPIDGKYLSKYEPLYIQKLNDIISSTMKAPMAFLPLNGKSTYINISKLTANDIGSSFSVVFWIYLDQPNSQSRINILRLYDRKSRGISVFVSTGQLLLTITNKTVESTAKCENSLPIRVWTPIILRFSFKNTKTYVVPVIEHFTCRRLEFNWVGLKEGPIEFNIGYSPEENQDEFSPVLLASFSFYEGPILNEKLPRIYDSGPRQFINETQDSKFSVHLTNNRGDTSLTTIGNVNAALIGNSVRCHPTFCDVLLSVNRAELFLPLYSFFDFPTVDNKYLTDVPELSFDLISSTLSINQDVQEAFETSKGFQIMSHLLSISNKFHPTYSSYIRYYSLLQSLTYEPLQRSLIKSILTDFTLLLKFDKSTQVRIVKHWARVLISVYPALLAEVKPIKDLLPAMEQYFHGVDQKSVSIRSNIFSLIGVIASENLTNEDLEILISFAIHCSAERSIEIIRLLIFLAQCECKSSNTIKDNSKIFFSLHKLIGKCNEELFLLLLDLIFELHDHNIITEITLQQHYDMILYQLNPHLISENILYGLIERINRDIFELLPISCFVAINMNEYEYTGNLFDNIKPHNLHLVPRFWVLAAACQSPPDIRLKALRFLMKCPISDWNDIFYSLDIISTVFNDEHIKHELVYHLFQKLNDTDSHSDFDLFYQFSCSTILFHRYNRSRVMEEEFEKSPFAKFARPKRDKNSSRLLKGKYQKYHTPRSFSVSSSIYATKGSCYCDNDDCCNSHLISGLGSESSSGETGEMSMTDLKKLTKRMASPVRASRYSLFEKELSQIGSCTTSDSDSLSGFEEEKRFKYGVQWLEKNIELFKNYRVKKVFLIRTDKNGRWLDCDVAICCMKLFNKWADPLFLGFALVLGAFLLKFHYPVSDVEDYLKKLSLNSAQKKTHIQLLHLIKHYVEIFNKNVTVPYLPVEADKSLAGKALKAFSKSRNKLFEKIPFKIADTFLTASRKISDLLINTAFLDDETIENTYTKFVSNFVFTEKVRKEFNSKSWSRCWCSFVCEMAPWEQAATTTNHETFERDMGLNDFLVPTRIRRKFLGDQSNKPNSSTTYITNDHLKSYKCKIISPLREKSAVLEIHSVIKVIYLIIDNRTQIISGDSIRYLIARNRFNSPTAFEVNLYNGKTYYIELDNIKSLLVLKEISEISSRIERPMITSPSLFMRNSQITQMWVSRKMSTFRYIVYLNMIAGRSFNDLTQYPIFPWILVNDTNSYDTIDFSDPRIYRNFSKYVTPKDISANKSLKANNILSENGTQFNFAPSYPYYVNLSLQNIPFKEEKLIHQSENPESANSPFPYLFYNSGGSLELVPEFYYLPECIDQNHLPKWANGSVTKFVYMHRKALESDVCSMKIHQWFDHVFGVNRQTSLYPSFMSEECRTKDYSTQEKIRKFGQLPQQIFNSPHPSRKPISNHNIMQSHSQQIINLNEQFESSSSSTPSLLSSEATDQHLISKGSLLNFKNEKSRPKFSQLFQDQTFELHIDAAVDQNVMAHYATFDLGNIPKSFIIHILFKNGLIKTFEIDINENQKKKFNIRSLSQSNIAIEHINKMDALDTIVPLGNGNNIISTGKNFMMEVNGGFIITNGQESLISLYLPVSAYRKENEISEIRAPFCNIRSLSSSGNLFATIGTDMTTRVFSSENPHTQLFSIPSYRSETTCCAMSNSFNVIVTGSIDGTMQICSLTSGNINHVVSVGYKLLHMCISYGWGFITAYCEKRQKSKRRFELELFTVNGMFISSTKLESELLAWETWSDTSGFDWIAISLRGGKVYVFELYYMNLEIPYYRTQKEIITIKYAQHINSLIMVNTSGEIIVKSLQVSNAEQ